MGRGAGVRGRTEPTPRHVRGKAGELGGACTSACTPLKVGRAGEELAARHLEEGGLEVIERNWRCPSGEVDIICSLGAGNVVLVEVKTRLDVAGSRGLEPEAAVGAAKRERYGRLAMEYIATHPGLLSVRFDVVAVVLTDLEHGRVRHIANAFFWDE